jgi:predicted metal-binding protein
MLPTNDHPWLNGTDPLVSGPGFRYDPGSSPDSNVRLEAFSMLDQNALEDLFTQHGFNDFRWIDPRDIEVALWVRMKCLYGCGSYGRNASCPPNTPSVEDCRRFFDEYRQAALFHFEKKVDHPNDRHVWSQGVNKKLVALEQEVFLNNYRKAFLLAMDECTFCKECSSQRTDCKLPRMARPSLESMAVDVYSTVKKYGYPIQVLSNYDQTMNRYAVLMID